MSNLAIFMMIRGLLSLSLTIGGIYALKKGFQLYLSGTGLREEQFELSAGKSMGEIKLSLKRIGTVVMLTAVVWGYLGFLVMPQKIVSNSSDGDSFSANGVPLVSACKEGDKSEK